MKEIRKEMLTGRFGTPKLIGGDIFMEGKSDMPPTAKSTSPEHAENISRKPVRPVSPEKQAGIRAALEKLRDPNLPVEVKSALEGFLQENIPPVAGAQDIDKTGIQNPLIAAEIDAINNAIDTELVAPSDVLISGITNVSKLVDVSEDEKRIAIERIKTAIEIVKEAERRRGISEGPLREQQQRFGLYLTSKDLRNLNEDPMRWLDSKFDILYKFADAGQELTSPIIQGMQGIVQQAMEFVQNYHPELLDQFSKSWIVRFHLIQNRTMIGYKSIENIQETARQLGTNGLLSSLNLEDGKVGAMFNRLNTLVEDERLAINKEHHITPKLADKLQMQLIDEQMSLSRKGVGDFGDLSDSEGYSEADFTLAATITVASEDERVNALSGLPEDARKRVENIIKIKADITRAVRTGYDAFVSSQRAGVIVARGRHLSGNDAYFSDWQGIYNVYNIEDLLWAKYDNYTAEQHEFVNRLKIALAQAKEKDRSYGKELMREEEVDLGRRLFRDLFAVPDFFTSGWRVKGILDSIQSRFSSFSKDELQGKESLNELLTEEEVKKYNEINSDEKRKEFLAEKRASEFALFFRLKDSWGGGKDLPKTRKIWEKINEYKPEEIIRLFRERKDGELGSLYASMESIDSELMKPLQDSTKDADDKNGVTTYDKFKARYGPVINLLRQKALRGDASNGYMPKQLDLSKLSAEDIGIVNRVLSDDPKAGKKLADLYRKMQEFISNNGSAAKARETQEYRDLEIEKESLQKDLAEKDKSAEDVHELKNAMGELNNKITSFERERMDDKVRSLLIDPAFEDIYTRVINVDDALLGELEQETFRGQNKKFTKLSSLYSVDQGGDALARTWNDTGNAIKASQGLLGFITSENPEERIKSATQFADATGSYNGMGAKANCIRFTVGTLLDLSKKDYFWDLFGIDKGPLRRPISDIQRIFGPQVKTMGRDELRAQLDHLHGLLVANLDKGEVEGWERLTEKEKHEYKEKAEKAYRDLEHILEVTAKDKLKMSALTFLIYLFMAVGGETFRSVKEAGKEVKV